MKVLVTGAAGFIGYFVSQKLLNLGHDVIGIDNLNNYYDINLKKNRLKQISSKNFSFLEIDLCESKNIKALFKKYNFDYVINLAAQAGVRFSLKHPEMY